MKREALDVLAGRLGIGELVAAADERGVVSVEVAGSEAMSAWEVFAREFGETGYWPVIRGAAGSRDEGEMEDPAEVLKRVPPGDAITKLREERERNEGAPNNVEVSIDPAMMEFLPESTKKMLAMSWDELREAAKAEVEAEDEAAWPAIPPAAEREGSPIHSVMNIGSGKFLKKVQISLVPVREPAEVAAVLGFGGWNEAPVPEIQVGVMRDWERRYGAKVIAMTGDVMECVVERPPMTLEEAKVFAPEQFVFCEDIVSQGTRTLQGLAVELWAAKRWFFWWD